jgi:hypothetical protein
MMSSPCTPGEGGRAICVAEMIALLVILLLPAHHRGRGLRYGAPIGSRVRAAVIAFAREGCFMAFLGSGDRGPPDDVRDRVRRRAVRRDRLILLALIGALIAVAMFGVTRLS